MNKPTPPFNLTRSDFTRPRIVVITLAVLAVFWVLISQFLLRSARCADQMCPVNDYEYLLRIVLIIGISSIAFWLLRPEKKQ